MTKPLTKKPYTEPKLIVYGDIGRITTASNNMGSKSDNGMGLNKTA